MCLLCGLEEETIDHILVGCSIVRSLWDLILALVVAQWVSPLTVRETVLSCYWSIVGKKRKKDLMLAPRYIFWIVWRETNKIMFNNEEILVQRMKMSFFMQFVVLN